MAKTMLKEIRVISKQDLKERIMKYIDEVNSDPIVFIWKYKMDTLSVI